MSGLIAAAAVIVLPLATVEAQTPPLVLNVTKAAPAQVLAGDPVSYKVTASNASGVPGFNLTFRDVLPLGVTYDGPTTPAAVGEPDIITNEVPDPLAPGLTIPQQTLIWSNVGDVQVGDSITFDFAVTLNETPDPTRPSLPVYEVGSIVTNTVTGSASADPRIVQRFLPATGVPIPNPAVVSDTASGGATTLTAIQVEKSEGSPEGELLRGVHRFTTAYTLDVRVTERGAVDGITVTDYLPAALEFLGCGGVDNSAAPEYLGAPSLAATPPPVPPTPCRFPDRVETVLDPPPQGTTTYAPGVYTKVTWIIPTIAADGRVTLRYAAGVPLRENELFSAPAPTPESGLQASNLDNNTGDSTRELPTESSVTNVARASGLYLGATQPGTSNLVSDDDRLTRQIEDMRIRKTIIRPTPNVFQVGQTVRYGIEVDVSEYVSASGIVLTDIVPNGLCPIGNIASTGCPTVDPTDVEHPTVPFASVTPVSGGGFTTVFEPIDLAAGQSRVVEYSARMLAEYADGEPPASGDTFTNTITSTATTTPIANSPETGTVTVNDASSATLTSGESTIDKRVLPRALLAPGAPCPTNPALYVDPPAVPTSDFGFRLGDEVCFLLTAGFDATIETRNAAVTDFLPAGVNYVNGSVAPVPGVNSVTLNFVDPTDPSGPLVFPLGDGPVGDRFVPAGGRLSVVFKSTVIDIPDGNVPLVTGNLMKMRTENTAGRGRSYRDRVVIQIVPAAEVGILKGVESVTAPPFSTADPNQDGKQVLEGSVVRFRLDVQNLGTPANFNDYSVRTLDVWDVLPVGITCNAISRLTDFAGNVDPAFAACTNPGQTGHPTFDGSGTRSAVRWQFPFDPADVDQWAILAGEVRTVTYDMTIPSPTSIGTSFVNRAAVRSFEAFTNVTDARSTFFPTNNIDNTVTADQENAPEATDTSSVFTPGASTSKSAVTSVTETNNDTPVDAVPGETITYTFSVTIPGGISVFNAVLADALPSQVEIVAPAPVWRFYPDASVNATVPDGSRPAGFVLSASGQLTFPPTYTNASTTAQRFEVDLTTRVLPTITEQPTITDTARFTSLLSPGGAPVVTPDATYQNQVVQALPSIAKSNDTDGNVVRGGQVITYTLTGRNAADRPPVHDAVLHDCIPVGLQFVAFGATTPGGTTTGPEGPSAANGCPPNTVHVAFAIGTIQPGALVQRSYTARVVEPAVGGNTYTNTARIVGSSLANGANDPVVEAVYAPAPVANTVRVPGAPIVKTVSPARATIGERVTYTVEVTAPRDVNFYQGAIRDRLPLGIDPDSVAFVSSDCLSIPNPAAPNPPPCEGTPVIFPPIVTVPATSPASYTMAAYFGDVLAEPYDRVLTMVYRAVLDDVPSNVSGVRVVNGAQSVWDDTDGPDATDANHSWTRTGDLRSASVLVVEPSLSLAKSVSDTTIDPGQVVQYTLRLNNAAGANVSPAYGASVTDIIPAGIDVLGSTISPPPTSFAAATAQSAGSIVWSATDLPGPVLPGGTATLSYQARLFASAEIDASARTNTARLLTYRGLPAGTDSNGNDRVYTGNSSSATVTPQFPKLTTAKTAVDGEPTYLDTPYHWRVQVGNSGNGPALGVSIQDQLPPNWTFVAGSTVITFPDGSTQSPAPIVGTGGACPVGRLCWPDLGRLDPGQTITLDYRALRPSPPSGTPGIGSSVRQENIAAANGFDLTAAPGNLAGSYGSGDVLASTRIDTADLVIDKAPAPGAVAVAGTNFSWTVRVSNKSGVDTAVGPFNVTDTLPPGVTFVSANGPGWTCTPASGVPTATSTTCVRSNPAQTLAPGAQFESITVTVGLPSTLALGSTLRNEASVSSRTFELLPADNADSDTITVGTLADLSILKTRTGTLLAGTPATYTLDVTNLGPSVSRAPITVRDPIPAGTTFVSASGGPDWAPCGLGTGVDANVVICTYTNDLAVGAPAPQISITVDVASAATGTITNTATVSGTTVDPNTGNNQATNIGTVTTKGDLRIDKQATGLLQAGLPATYRIRVDNDGPSDALNLTITDTLPTGLTYVSATSVTPAEPGGWVCTPALDLRSFACTLPSLAARDLPVVDGFATVDITVNVASDVQGQVVNTANVSSTTPDDNLTNNTDSDDSVFGTEADLAITKTSPGTAVAGGPLTWTLQVTNNGPSDSQPVITVQDVLPAGTEFVSAGTPGDPTAWSCSLIPPTLPADRPLVSCTRSTVLVAAPAPASVAPPIALVVRVLPDAGPSTIENHASVTGVTNDPVLSNNSDDDKVVVSDLAELSILKTTTGANPVLAGESTQFRIVVSNDGPSDADTVVVDDLMPSGLVATAASGTGWACGLNDGARVICSRDTLAPGSAPAIVVEVDVDEGVANGTTIPNTATVSTSTNEQGTKPNTSTSSVSVQAEADLAVAKSHNGPIRIGDEFDFSLDVSNAGPSAARDVVVVDTLPAGLVPQSASGPTGWTCGVTGQTVDCAFTGLFLRDATAAITVTALVEPAAFPTVTNTASIGSSTFDPVTTNNTSDDDVAVPALVDLTIAKSHTPPVEVGNDIVFTLVVGNRGPIDDSAAVTVVDEIPASLAPVSVSSDDAECSLAGQTLTCVKADGLAVGGTFSITVVATVTPAAYPTIENSASVSSPTDDVDPTNNSSTDAASVPPLVDLAISKVHTGGTIRVGSTTGYSLTVTNSGPTSDPGPISITDTLPAGLTPVSASGDGLTCAIAGSTVTCTSTGPLAVGASVTVAITANVEAAAYPSVTNTATVATPSEETSLTNNSSTTTDPVEPLVILDLTKSLESQLGSSAVWSFVVTNRGPNATVVPIVVTDPLPSGLVFEGASGDGWICVAPTILVTCTYSASLAVGSSAPLLHIATTINAPRGSTIVNVASVDGGGPDTPAVTSQATVTTPSAGLPITGGDPGTLGRFAALVGLLGLSLFALSRRRRRLTTPPT